MRHDPSAPLEDTTQRPSVTVSRRRPISPGGNLGQREYVADAVRPAGDVSQFAASNMGTESKLSVQSKVRAPAIPAETLERRRLLEWLTNRTGTRVVLVVAEAGYGKTTLLADFTSRSHIRTLWYRLESGDRDWVTLISHIVASGREIDAEFGEHATRLLSEPASSRSFESAVAALASDFELFKDSSTVVIFDDFHLVEDSSDAREVARELLARAPQAVSFVFSGRRRPSVPLAKLRAEGRVAELGTDDLRFDVSETEDLLNDARGMKLDTDVVTALNARTEGWIASLRLVKTAIRDRSAADVRRFVKDLTGADQELYDYLAEVVVGDLPDDLQAFLMATSVLQVVTPSLAHVVTDIPTPEVARLSAAAERLALLTRVAGGPRTHLRYHPLVREFLEARLLSVEGAERVAALHSKVAVSCDEWHIAAYHYRQAGDMRAVLRTLDQALPTIMANGQYSLAESFLETQPPNERMAGRQLVLGRVDLQLGDYAAAAANAESVLQAQAASEVQRDHALLNLLAVRFNFGDGEKALDVACQLGRLTGDERLRQIAEATKSILLASTAKDLDEINRRLKAMARRQRQREQHHFGVSMFNLAANSVMQDRIHDAQREVEAALEAFSGNAETVESRAATVLLLTIQLRNGDVDRATQGMRALLDTHVSLEDDVLLDAAEAFHAYGSQALAIDLLDRTRDISAMTLTEQRANAVVRAQVMLRRGAPEAADAAIRTYPPGLTTVVGMNSWRTVTEARVALALGDDGAAELLRSAVAGAKAAGIHSARRVAELIYASTQSPRALSDAVVATAQSSPWTVTSIAEVIAPKLNQLSVAARDSVASLCAMHPDRWRAELRHVVGLRGPSMLDAAAQLEEIGEPADIPLLRLAAKSAKGRQRAELGRALARRVAERVWVEDQGRVVVHVGHRVIPGSTIRRKVLSLLCYLLTRPETSATRDQVLDSIWPDLDPDVAGNSLNQTLYFLRRVFEEPYEEDLSPGFVHHHGDVIWLDRELVSSRSIECKRMMEAFGGNPTPEDVERLTATYRARFALDFEYEEWAAAYRDSLHAAYLEVVERALLQDVRSGHHGRAIWTAQRALSADPDCDHVEIALLRLYKATGAHSAAAEQYQHYAAVMRDDLGIEPPALESL